MNTLEKYDNFIFDLDGTLVDSAYDIIIYLKQAYQSIGIKDINIPSTVIGPPLSEIINTLTPELPEEKKFLVVSRFKNYCDNNPHDRITPYPNVKEILHILENKKKKIFLATNKRFKSSISILENFNILSHFSDIMSSDYMVGTTISKSKMLEILIEKHLLLKNKTIMIGDSLSDYTASYDNGIEFIFCSYGYGEDCDIPLQKKRINCLEGVLND